MRDFDQDECRDDIPDNDGAWATIVPPTDAQYHIFEESDGWHWSPKNLDYLDARGKGYPTKSQARKAAEYSLKEQSLINWTPCPDCGQTLCHGECK